MESDEVDRTRTQAQHQLQSQSHQVAGRIEEVEEAVEVELPLLHLGQEPVSTTANRDMSSYKPGTGRWDSIGLGLISAGLGILSLGTFAFILSGDLSKLGWFAFHPTLQTLCILSLVFGITPLQPPTPTSSQSRKSRFTSHQTRILRLSLPSKILGVAVIAYNKYIHASNHLTSWHAVFGAGCTVWMVGQVGMGVGIAWYGKEMFGSEGEAKRWYKWHRLSGYALVVFILITINLAGGYSHWAMKQGTPLIRALVYWASPMMVLIGLGMRMQTNKMQIGTSRR